MNPPKNKLCRIVLDTNSVQLLNARLITANRPEWVLTKADIVTSALTLATQWSLPKEECLLELSRTGRPCTASCVCYTHAILNAVLEVVTDGPKAEYAAEFIQEEYLCNAVVPTTVH